MDSAELAVRERLFAAHQHKAVAVVDAYCRQINPTVSYLKQDIMGEALMALWCSCLRFKETDSNTFWTFAYLRVKGSITDFLRREKLQVRGDRLDLQVHFVSLDEYQDSRSSTDESRSVFIDEKSTAEISAIEMRSEIDQSMRVAGLTQAETSILNQYYAEGRTVSEISEITSSTEAMTCRLISSSTRKVREASL